MRRRGLSLLMLVTTACDAGFLTPADPDEPTELVYQLIPSGDPYSPAGILLRWTAPTSGRALTYDVYARSSTSEEFGLRATTTSTSFHDEGIPQLQYYVEALDADGESIGQSEAVEVDERNRLPAPRSLTSVTLNNAVQLQWDPNAYEAAPDLFDLYRVYSTVWSVAAGCDLGAWALEGTTVSDGFISRGLPNGETRCFAVSAISRDGHESIWSAVREDTPRYDARSIVLDASDIRRASSAFVFMTGTSGGFGAVVSDTTPGADVVLERRSDGALWFRAARPETRVMQYGVSPISDLTSIDRAPVAGYVDAARVMAGFGYVFRVQSGDGVRYAAVRVLHTTTDYALFDFSFQSQIGNVELLRAP